MHKSHSELQQFFCQRFFQTARLLLGKQEPFLSSKHKSLSLANKNDSVHVLHNKRRDKMKGKAFNAKQKGKHLINQGNSMCRLSHNTFQIKK